MKQQKPTKLFSKKNNNKNKKKENYEKSGVQVVEQKESSQNNSSKIEDILNHPILKRRLPPIERKQNTETNEEEKIENEFDNNINLEEEINNNIENLNFNEKEDEIKDSLEIEKEIENYKKIEETPKINTIDKVEKKINIIIEKKIKSEIGTGTPYYVDNIQDLKNEVDNKSKIISKLSDEQNDYKFKLNELFQKLNKLLAENAELLLSEEDQEDSKKQENLNELIIQLELKKKGINSSKNQNKIYKQQYDLLTNKEKNTKNENIEKKIDKLKLENCELIKQIKTLKSQSRKDGKKLEDYSYNGKYLSDINKISTELKTLENKKHEYFKKLANSNKFINNCVKELENLENYYSSQKSNKNYFNAKVEEEINRLKEDLSGNEEEIIKRIETDSAFIIRKLIHNEKINNNIFKTPIPNKPADAKKMKLKKGNSLEPLVKLKLARNNIHSGQSRRMNIVAKNKSPLLTNINNNHNKDQDDFDPTKINYNDLTDFEYNEMISKKSHCYDVVTRLEKSIKEAQKMYQRKVKEIKTTLEENSQKLNTKNKENELLKAEIDDLNKILSLSEQENKIMIGQNTKPKKNNKINNNNNNNEKELESQKEYLSPEYYNNHNNNNKEKEKDKDKMLIPTHSNTDMTRNEILNDLKVLNGPNLDEGGPDSIIVQKNSGKISNFGMKFPDLSNIEENINVNINPKNEFERNKAIDDIKKKYNIKTGFDDNNDDLNDDLNLDEENDEEKMIKEQERLKREEFEERQRLEKEFEDEEKFFKEHEKILNNKEEGQFEPPIDDNNHYDEPININKGNNEENEEEDNNDNEELKQENDNKLNIEEDKIDNKDNIKNDSLEKLSYDNKENNEEEKENQNEDENKEDKEKNDENLENQDNEENEVNEEQKKENQYKNEEEQENQEQEDQDNIEGQDNQENQNNQEEQENQDNQEEQENKENQKEQENQEEIENQENQDNQDNQEELENQENKHENEEIQKKEENIEEGNNNENKEDEKGEEKNEEEKEGEKEGENINKKEEELEQDSIDNELNINPDKISDKNEINENGDNNNERENGEKNENNNINEEKNIDLNKKKDE